MLIRVALLGGNIGIQQLATVDAKPQRRVWTPVIQIWTVVVAHIELITSLQNYPYSICQLNSGLILSKHRTVNPVVTFQDHAPRDFHNHAPGCRGLILFFHTTT